MENGARSNERVTGCTEHRAWRTEHGAWSMEHRALRTEYGTRSMEHEAWSMKLSGINVYIIFLNDITKTDCEFHNFIHNETQY